VRRGVARTILIATLLVSVAGFVIALWPEPPARILTPAAQWIKSSGIGEFTPGSLPPQWRQVRESVRDSRNAILYRNYRAETGVRPASVASGPFRAEGLLSVVVEGSADASLATVRTSISCSTSDRQIQVERGGVNVNVSEALVEIPRGWCTGNLRLLQTTTSSDFAGVGSVSALAPISGLKQSFIGLLPYLTASIVIFSLIGLAGALGLRTLVEPLPAAMAAIGAVFLATFFTYALAPHAVAQLALLLLSLSAVGIFLIAPREERRRVVVALFPYAASWILVCVGAAALLTLAYNGNGHWEPNYRFQPAQWSSDFELPWIFAEALRKNYDIPSLFGGWRPTDRPPLMTGGHLLVSELFSVMQSAGNDGDYLRGIAYNMSAIAMSALWTPAVLYFFVSTLHVPWRRAVTLVFFMAAVPFFLFNTIYGWPKLLGAAFGVLATVAALEHWRRAPQTPIIDASVLFGAFAAFSILAHASNAFFLLALGSFIFWRRLWRAPKALAAGAGTGLIMMAPWTLYQRFVAPSDNPLLKYALAGDFGFGAPNKSVLDWVRDRYASLSFSEWAAIKTKLVISPFWPVTTGIADVRRPPLMHASVLDILRQWDFYFLSAGNAVLLMGLVSLCFTIASADDETTETLLPARLVAKLSLFTFLLVVLTFFSVLIIHTLPYALIVSAGAAGLAALSLRPSLFRVLAGLTLAYVLVVWIAAPLTAAIHIDWLAGLALLSVVGNMWLLTRTEALTELSRPSPSRL
jgi:hypothetical protein